MLYNLFYLIRHKSYLAPFLFFLNKALIYKYRYFAYIYTTPFNFT